MLATSSTPRLSHATFATTLSTFEQELRVAYNETQQASPDAQIKGGKLSIILPSSLVRSFFVPTTTRIADCLRGLKGDPALSGLRYVFLVGGFSSSPLVQQVVRAEVEGGGCAVVASMRPDVAIVKGAVLFANNTQAFSTRKARLTYGIIIAVVYDALDPEHVRRRSVSPVFDEDGREMIEEFSRHVIRGDDVPADRTFPMQSYKPIRASQVEITLKIFASHRKDIRFPDKDVSFALGSVTVPLNMDIALETRRVHVHFSFGGTELSVKCYREEDGNKIGQVQLSIVQEVQ